jgi:hypothetical protein
MREPTAKMPQSEHATTLGILLSACLISGTQWIDSTVYLTLSIIAVCWVLFTSYLPALPAVFLLTLDRAEFGASETYWQGEREVSLLRIAGFPVSLRMVVAIGMFIVVAFNLVSGSRQARAPGVRPWLILWFIGLGFAVVGAYLGLVERFEGWTRGARHCLSVGAVFYGIFITRSNSERNVKLALSVAVGASALLLSIGLLGLVTTHLMFLAVAIVASWAISKIKERRKWLGTLALSLAVWYSYTNTFTFLGIVLFTVILVIVTRRASGSISLAGHGSSLISGSVIFAGVAFVVLVANANEESLGVDQQIRTQKVETSIQERLVSKIYADRNLLWRPALAQIVDGDYLFPPAGRPLELSSIYLEGGLWIFGPHCSYLDIPRNSGLIGFGAIIILVYCVLRKVLGSIGTRFQNTYIVAPAVFSTIAVGLVMGDFVMDINAGVLIWCLAGVCIGSWRNPDLIKSRFRS